MGRRRKRGKVRLGVEAQLAAQVELGHLEPIDSGLIEVARTLADCVDEEMAAPDGSLYTVGALAGRLVPVLLELRGERELGGFTGVDDELAEIASAIRDASRPEPPHPS